MESFDIVVLIAIILFARLGLRLVTGYNDIFKEPRDSDQDDKVLDSAQTDKGKRKGNNKGQALDSDRADSNEDDD